MAHLGRIKLAQGGRGRAGNARKTREKTRPDRSRRLALVMLIYLAAENGRPGGQAGFPRPNRTGGRAGGWVDS
jgi:hypothetical protein